MTTMSEPRFALSALEWRAYLVAALAAVYSAVAIDFTSPTPARPAATAPVALQPPAPPPVARASTSAARPPRPARVIRIRTRSS
jgi:hypothetical protein